MTAIPVSTVPAAQSYLLAAIEAAVAADPDSGEILVCLGEPSTLAPPVIIEVGKEVRRTPSPSAFVGTGGAGFLEETYELDIVVSAAEETVDTDTDPLALSERAWQLVAYVETAVRSDPSLGDLVQLTYPSDVHGGEVTWAPNNVGRECELTVVLHVEALI